MIKPIKPFLLALLSVPMSLSAALGPNLTRDIKAALQEDLTMQLGYAKDNIISNPRYNTQASIKNYLQESIDSSMRATKNFFKTNPYAQDALNQFVISHQYQQVRQGSVTLYSKQFHAYKTGVLTALPNTNQIGANIAKVFQIFAQRFYKPTIPTQSEKPQSWWQRTKQKAQGSWQKTKDRFARKP